MSPAPESPVPPYQVLHRLARGGMGVVDLARGPDGSLVALKRVSLYGATHHIATARSRIRREADALRRLRHPAIVELIDVLDDGDDLVLVMPYMAGGSLADRVERDGPLPAHEVSQIRTRLLSALAAAHRAGVVHRDVTPGNVLFDAAGRCYLADFGAATDRDATPGLTAPGFVVGTASFLSPERAAGGSATPAGDVFSAGATLVFAATGAGPWGQGRPEMLVARAARSRRVKVPRHVPAWLRHQLEPLLQVDPRARPTAAASLGGVDATVPLRRHRRRMGTAAVVAAVLAGSGLGLGASALASTRTQSFDVARVDTATAPPPKSTTCPDLPYQPCGQDPAPNTDGKRCLAGTADYDGTASNGCEAVPDDMDGSVLDTALRANIVPAGDTDTYRVRVEDSPDLLCNGRVRFTLHAGEGSALRLEVIDRGRVAGTTLSSPGTPGTVSVSESCIRDDSRWMELRVTSVGAPSAEAYRLERQGSF